MKMRRHLCGLLLAFGIISAGSVSLAEEAADLMYVPGQELLLLDQNDIQIFLKGNSFETGFENGIAVWNSEVKNNTDQDVSIWYSGSVNRHELNEDLWYLCTAPAHSVVKADIVNQDPVFTLTNYEDLVSLQLQFSVYDAGFQEWFEEDVKKIRFETIADPAEQESIEEGEQYPEYDSAQIGAFLEELPDRMETVKTDVTETIWQIRVKNGKEKQMFADFSIYEPSVSREELVGVLQNLASAADWLVFDLYDFQMQSLNAYTDKEPVNLELLNTCMSEMWESFKGLDFAAGRTRKGNTDFYWMPVYYGAEEQGALNDELYLYVYAMETGADVGFLDEMGIYDPMPGEFRAEQFMITDRDTVAAFIQLLQQDQNLERAEAELDQYEVLEEDCSGDEVRALQKRLTDLGYLTSSIDGYFGPMTKEAVMRYQEAEGMEVTGIADAQTQWSLLAEQDERNWLKEWMQRNAG